MPRQRPLIAHSLGTRARTEIEAVAQAKVFLKLWVKVAKDWRENPQRVRELDWHFQLKGLSTARADEGEEPPIETE